MAYFEECLSVRFDVPTLKYPKFISFSQDFARRSGDVINSSVLSDGYMGNSFELFLFHIGSLSLVSKTSQSSVSSRSIVVPLIDVPPQS